MNSERAWPDVGDFGNALFRRSYDCGSRNIMFVSILTVVPQFSTKGRPAELVSFRKSPVRPLLQSKIVLIFRPSVIKARCRKYQWSSGSAAVLHVSDDATLDPSSGM